MYSEFRAKKNAQHRDKHICLVRIKFQAKLENHCNPLFLNKSQLCCK